MKKKKIKTRHFNVTVFHDRLEKTQPWNPKKHPDCFSLYAYHSDGMPGVYRHPTAKKPWHLIDIEWETRKQTTPEFRRKHRIWFGAISSTTVLGNNKAREIYREFKKVEGRIKKDRKHLRELFNEILKMNVYSAVAKKLNKKDKSLVDY